VAEDAAAAILGKVALGGAVGFALFFLAAGLGLGGRGEGRGEPKVPAELPSAPPPSPLPSRTRDEKRLTFVMQEPEAVGRPMAFRLRDDDPSTKTYSLEETITRIKAGGRSDVSLRIRGSVIQGPADEALKLLKRAGIQVWKEEAPQVPSTSPAVSGNLRGHYGSPRRTS
jgi:hypothetical protein